MMASLDLSLGTVLGDNNERRIGGRLKVSLYKQKDPLLKKGVYDDIQKSFAAELVLLAETEKRILKELDTITKPTDLIKKREDLRENDAKMASFYGRRNAAIQEQAKNYITDN